MPGMRAGALQYRRDTAGDRYVVVLDQDRVVEPEAMVEAAAAAHRIFLERAQARRRFAGAADAQIGAGGMTNIIGGEGCDGREPGAKIQHGALARPHSPRPACNPPPRQSTPPA